jgi:hypothetical protein
MFRALSSVNSDSIGVSDTNDSRVWARQRTDALCTIGARRDDEGCVTRLAKVRMRHEAAVLSNKVLASQCETRS